MKRNLTIKIFNRFFNYDNVSQFQFKSAIDDSEKNIYWVTVWDTAGKYTEIYFKSEGEWKYAQEKFEEGLINDFVFIDLNL